MWISVYLTNLTNRLWAGRERSEHWMLVLLLRTHRVLAVVTITWVIITWGSCHLRNVENEKLPLPIMKSIPCQPRKHPYQWSAAANHVAPRGQLLPFSRISRPYRPVVHVESGKLGHRLSQELGVALPWLHCLNLISTAPQNASMVKNASMLKNSKLGQNDGMLRIIDSAFVQTASLCCLHLLFSSIICIVLHVRKNINTALTVTSHSQLLLSCHDWDDSESDGDGGCSRIRSSSRSSCSSRIRHFELILLILIKNCMELTLDFWYFWDVNLQLQCEYIFDYYSNTLQAESLAFTAASCFIFIQL